MENKRRAFIKKVGLAGAAIAGAPTALLAENASETQSLKRTSFTTTSPSKLNIALIGAGGMGVADTNTALQHEDIKLVAVCDLYDGRLEAAKKRWGDELMLTRDYKDILKRKDIDVVIIGTPDHWHMQISVDALKAGKHVYCEKPMVHSVAQGQSVIDAWKKSGKIFMVGSQGLSSLGNEKAKELLEAGVIGDLNYAEGFWARHSPQGAWQYKIPTDATEKNVDWKAYISNTKQRDWDPVRFFRWRNYLDYGTGMSGDLFVHLFSSLHFITSSKGPDQISSMGGLRYWKDGRDVPDVLLGMFQYPEAKEHPGFNLSLRCNFVDGTSGTTYLKLIGSEGSMNVGWDDVTVERNRTRSTDDPFLKEKMKGGKTGNTDRKEILPPQQMVYKVDKGYKGAHYDHFANFFRAIREGGSVVEDPIFGFRAAAPALLCNDSYFGNKYITWDPINMKVTS